MEIQIGNQKYQAQWWNPSIRLRGTMERPLAVDTETEMIQPGKIPRLALATAADATTAVWIHPSKVAEFLSMHRLNHLVFHNIGFDYWSLTEHSKSDTLKHMVNESRCHDTMILGQLIQLATGNFRVKHSEEIYSEGLSALADQYELKGILDKTDLYRMRYNELLGMTEEEISAHPEATGFLGYAIKDAIVTHHLYPPMRERAIHRMIAAGWNPSPQQKRYEIAPNALKRWGPLTEQIQVRAAVVLAQMSRRPIRVQQEKRIALEWDQRKSARENLTRMASLNPDSVGVYTLKTLGTLSNRSEKTGLPTLSRKPLQSALTRIGYQIGIVPPTSGKKKEISTQAKVWAQWRDRHPFLSEWCDLEHTAKRLEFLAELRADEVYTNYNLMVRSGRTSAKSHKNLPGVNIQQMPKEPQFRELFVADPGTQWYVVDYSYLELRTLAAVCRARFGYSKLGDAIDLHTNAVRRGDDSGLDPHHYMGMVSLGIEPEEYRALPKDVQKRARQKAKVANFGLPGGLGVAKLIEYAKGYGVELDDDSARALKQQWFDVYPEMREYLADDTFGVIASNLGLPRRSVASALGSNAWHVSSVINGRTEDERILGVLRELCKGDVKPGPDLSDRLLTTPASTLTGRVRAGCKYTDARNTPFQGLAADGAKLALWNLFYAGFDLVAFVHDEIIVSLPLTERLDSSRIESVRRIMNESMESVMGHGVPCEVDGKLADHWVKE